jgi:hypothetical protein
MSKNGIDIRVDDLILFFRAEGKEDAVVNRLIPHNVYTAEERRIDEVDDKWKDVVLSEPSLPGNNGASYHVANLARLQLLDAAPKADLRPLPSGLWDGATPVGQFKDGDLVIYPPDQPQAWFHIPRTTVEKCDPVPASQVSDLDFMASEEGAVLANVPKVTPQGCTCILLSLVGLRSGMLQQAVVKSGETKTISTKGHDAKQLVDKTAHAKLMPDALRRGHQKR